jgi:hypothetical protein
MACGLRALRLAGLAAWAARAGLKSGIFDTERRDGLAVDADGARRHCSEMGRGQDERGPGEGKAVPERTPRMCSSRRGDRDQAMFGGRPIQHKANVPRIGAGVAVSMIGLVLNKRHIGRCSLFPTTDIALTASPGRFAPDHRYGHIDPLAAPLLTPYRPTALHPIAAFTLLEAKLER